MAANGWGISGPLNNSDLIHTGTLELANLFQTLYERKYPKFVASGALVVVLRFYIRETTKMAFWSTAGDSGSMRSSPELVRLGGKCL